MKKPLFTLFIVCVLFFSKGSAQNIQWARSFEGASRNHAVAVDVWANVLTCGMFSGVVDFDPSSAVYTLVPQGTQPDAFISKLDAFGNLLWAKKIGVNHTDKGYGIATDASGNVYMVGCFAGAVDFDPGPAIYIQTTPSQSGTFLLKLDAAGNFVFVDLIIGSGVYGKAITLDVAGNIHLSGTFSGTVDFDPGPGTNNLTATANSQCAFVLKLDAVNNFKWARAIVGGQSYADALTVDAFGSVYSTGYFDGTTDFNPGPAVSNLTSFNNWYDVYILKLDVLGNFVWVKNLWAVGGDWGTGITLDGLGNIYLAGTYQGIGDFDPGPGNIQVASIASSNDIFVMKMDAMANVIWLKTMGSGLMDVAEGLAIDGQGNVYTTGHFESIVDFDPGPGVFTFTQTGGSGDDVFISKLDASGNFVWAKQIQSGWGMCITTDGYNNVYAAGWLEGPGNTMDLKPGAFVLKLCNDNPLTVGQSNPIVCAGSTVALTASGANNYTWNPGGLNTASIVITPTSSTIYTVLAGDATGCSNKKTLVQLVDLCIGINEVSIDNHDLKIYPNPCNEKFSIEFDLENEMEISLELTDILGKTVKTVIPRSTQSIGKQSIPVQTNDLPTGVYFVKMMSGNKETLKKLIIMY